MTLRPAAWFRRLADVPGVGYAGSPGVERTRLPGHDAVPEIEYDSLFWNDRTSASPAAEYGFDEDRRSFNSAQVVRHVRETVELPGAPDDYHFVLQDGVAHLWRLRTESPEGLDVLEEFALLDLRLIEAAPWCVQWPDEDGDASFVSLSGIDRLIVLLEREGAHREALAVAERLAVFDNTNRLERIRERVATLDSYA